VHEIWRGRGVSAVLFVIVLGDGYCPRYLKCPIWSIHWLLMVSSSSVVLPRETCGKWLNLYVSSSDFRERSCTKGESFVLLRIILDDMYVLNVISHTEYRSFETCPVYQYLFKHEAARLPGNETDKRDCHVTNINFSNAFAKYPLHNVRKYDIDTGYWNV